MLALKVQLLGEFRVWRVTSMGEDLIAPHEWPTRQTKSLFKILALNPGRILLKDQLIEFLWPDAELDRALNRLWATVCMLRRVLEPSLQQASGSCFISTQGEGYMLDASRVWLDIREFLERIHQGDINKKQKKFVQAIAAYRAAEELYRGDLLEEDRYEEWTFIPREQFQEAYYRLLQDLGDCYTAQRRFSEALKVYQRALMRNICRESIWQRLMVCHYQLGERDMVLQAFQRCQQALRTHLQLEPSTATTELCQQLLKDTGVLTLPPPAMPAPSPLIWNEAWCIQILRSLRWPQRVSCISCGSSQVTHHACIKLTTLSRASAAHLFRYRCSRCYSTFNDLSGTIFAHSNLPLSKWFLCLQLLDEELSIRELASKLEVNKDTAWRMRNVLREALVQDALIQQLQRHIKTPYFGTKNFPSQRKFAVINTTF